jgi:hypothetical protein
MHVFALAFAAALLVVPAISAAAVPSQFIAKQYSEALGRAPDPASWQAGTDFFLSRGCSAATLRSFATGLFASTEYSGKRYTAAERTLTVYRAILSREPDPTGLAYWTGPLGRGATAQEMAGELAKSEEFDSLVGDICAGGAYRRDWGLSQAMDIGSGTWTQARLEDCIKEQPVCSIPPRTVVYLNSTVTLPAGRTLTTAGNPDRLHYARQARIVRNTGSFGHLLVVQKGAAVRDIWLSGQRHLFKDVPTDMDEVRANIWYVGGDGSVGGLVNQIRSDFPLVRSHIVSVGPGGFLDIDDNLFTGYTSNHTPDGTQSWVTDGISHHASRGTIRNNHIIDPTDVGIVIFGRGNSRGPPQASNALSNVIVHAGLSAYGSVGFDTTAADCVFCVFTGSISGNTILAGPNQHSDIMLFVGTGPWAGVDCRSGFRCGTGARMVGNNTIHGDVNQVVKVQIGLLVDGMLNATTGGNSVDIAPQPLGACYRGGPEVISDSAKADSHPRPGCIVH